MSATTTGWRSSPTRRSPAYAARLEALKGVAGLIAVGLIATVAVWLVVAVWAPI